GRPAPGRDRARPLLRGAGGAVEPGVGGRGGTAAPVAVRRGQPAPAWSHLRLRGHSDQPHRRGAGSAPPLLRRLSSRLDRSTWRRLALALIRFGAYAGRMSEITEVLNRPLSQELLARDLTRLAYVARDGTPRVVPIGFVWNGTEIVMCTAKNAAKLPALRHNPAVALTIDTEVHPPKTLLIRGRAELDVVEGIPDEYLQMNGSYTMTPEQRGEGEAGGGSGCE